MNVHKRLADVFRLHGDQDGAVVDFLIRPPEVELLGFLPLQLELVLVLVLLPAEPREGD